MIFKKTGNAVYQVFPVFFYSDTQDENIKQNGTTESATSYELDSITIPIKLKATKVIGGKTLAKQTVDIN